MVYEFFYQNNSHVLLGKTCTSQSLARNHGGWHTKVRMQRRRAVEGNAANLLRKGQDYLKKSENFILKTETIC